MLKRFGATKVVLGLLCLMYFITYIDRVNYSTASIAFETEFGLSKKDIGFAFSVFGYPYLIFQIFGGWLGDRFGPRMTLTVCSMIWAGATFATGFVESFTGLIIARLFLGLGEGATFPTATRAMSGWTPTSERGFAQGITHAFARIGNTVTPYLVTGLIAAWSWRGSYFIIGTVSLVWALVWLFYFRNHPADHPDITEAELQKLPPQRGRQMVNVPWMPLFRRMLPVTIVYFCYGWALWLFLSWIPQYFEHGYHLKLKDTAFFATSVFLAGVIGDSLGGTLSDWILKRTGNVKLARRNMVAVCLLGALLSLLPMLRFHDLTTSTICLSAGFFFIEMTIGPMWAIPMDIAPAYSGTASGFMNSGSALAAIISPVVAGWMIDETGNWDLPFLCSIVLLGVGVVLSFTMHPERRFDSAPLPGAGAAVGG
ncbi:MAG TPA: MFS transporter [Aliidongia sp.]|nr:MFS transporter [Aliidongia sp.]